MIGSKVLFNTLVLQVYVALVTRPLAMACKRLLLKDGIKKHHLSTSPLVRKITLDDIVNLLHLLIRGKLLYHSRIKLDEAHEIMIIYLRDDLIDALM